MTKRLIKTRKDHRQLRASLTENTVTVTMTPAAGALTAGEVDAEYAGVTFALSANAIGAAAFSVATGELPPGLDLVGSDLEGTPTEAGNYSFSIRGTDDFGNTVVNAYTLAVTAP